MKKKDATATIKLSRPSMMLDCLNEMIDIYCKPTISTASLLIRSHLASML